jgi:RNA polymerase sigma-70 factor (ECF subfamily)
MCRAPSLLEWRLRKWSDRDGELTSGAADVADVNRMRLRGQLVENYEGLIRKLTRCLGSADFAHEALHETFLRLDRVTDAVTVRSPAEYIFRIAINIANDRRRAQNNRLGASEIDALLDFCDDGPDPARVVEARSDIDALKRALAELPPRPREVLHRIAIEQRSTRDVATQLGVSVRTIDNDLRLALKHCANCLDYTLVRRLGGPRPRS